MLLEDCGALWTGYGYMVCSCGRRGIQARVENRLLGIVAAAGTNHKTGKMARHLSVASGYRLESIFK